MIRYAMACIPYGLVVRIPGFHPGGPGSIPGVGNCFTVWDLVKNLESAI